MSGTGPGGYESQSGYGYGDFWMVKFVDTTVVNVGVNAIEEEDCLFVYPNPADDFLVLDLSTHSEATEALLFDLYHYCPLIDPIYLGFVRYLIGSSADR